MKIHNLVSGTIKKHVTWVSSPLKPALWSPDTGRRIPCFDSCQLTVKWISHIKLQRRNYMHELTQADLYIFFGRHPVRLGPQKYTSEPAICPCDTGQHVYCFDSFQLTWMSNPMSLSRCELMFTKPAWLRSPCLCRRRPFRRHHAPADHATGHVWPWKVKWVGHHLALQVHAWIPNYYRYGAPLLRPFEPPELCC